MNKIYVCIGLIALLILIWIILGMPGCPSTLSGDPDPPPTKVRFINKTKRAIRIEARDLELEMKPADAAQPVTTFGDDEDTVKDAPIDIGADGGGNSTYEVHLLPIDPIYWGNTFRLEARITLTGITEVFNPEVTIDQTEDFRYDFRVLIKEAAKTVGGKPGIEYSVTIKADYDDASKVKKTISDTAKHFVPN